ncbi:MAG: FMN-binding negative transcriptional regulator [Pseudomonadota bacterium]
MYKPKHFSQDNVQEMQSLMAASPLATLVIVGEHGLVANHIPFVCRSAESRPTQLIAHIPRVNPLSQILSSAKNCLAIFHGPDGYISPSYYATKPKHGKVVPTWNYSVVHVHGVAKLVDDPSWVREQIELLTNVQEGRRASSWSVSDAPGDFVESLVKALVGIEVSVDRIEGKIKASQNQPEANQRSVLKSIEKDYPDSGLSRLMQSVLDR